MAAGDAEHRLASSLGGFKGWANTADRAARMAAPQSASPSSTAWHARKLFGPNVDLEALTDAQWRQAEAARSAWYRDFGLKGLRARKLAKAARLREQAARIEVQAR
jgi:hypothetical protein